MDPLLFIVAIPFGILIGLGAGVIGLTAWPLVVPLLLVFGGLPLHEVLLSSLLIDLVITTILSVFYTKKTEVGVNPTFGIKLGLLAGIIAAMVAFVVFPFLVDFTDYFESGSSIITLVLGGFFIFQAFRMKESNTPDESSRKPSMHNDEKRKIIAIGICIIQGILTGFIAMGGAMNFVIVLIFLLGYPTLRAVGTAMITTAIMVGMTAIIYLVLLSFTLTTLPIILWYILLASVSSILSVTKAQNIPERRLRFTIGIVVLISAILATVQVYLI